MAFVEPACAEPDFLGAAQYRIVQTVVFSLLHPNYQRSSPVVVPSRLAACQRRVAHALLRGHARSHYLVVFRERFVERTGQVLLPGLSFDRNRIGELIANHPSSPRVGMAFHLAVLLGRKGVFVQYLEVQVLLDDTEQRSQRLLGNEVSTEHRLLAQGTEFVRLRRGNER